MVTTFPRKRIDILVDHPLCDWLVEVADEAGIAHHSFIQVLSGSGQAGSWRTDDGFGAVAKQMFVAVSNETKVERFLDLLAPHIETYGLVVAVSDVQVIRGERF